MPKQRLEGVIAVRGKGVGFVAIQDREEDVFIDPESLSNALDGDLVEIEITKTPHGGKKAEGRVTKVIKRKFLEFVGVVKKCENQQDPKFFILPDNTRIHIRPILKNANPEYVGIKVVFSLKEWDDANVPPEAEIVEVLGKAGQHETEMQAIIRSGGFTQNFPEIVLKAAQDVFKNQEQLFEDAKVDKKRKDMRDRTTMTIDPADAKDFDDALSIQKLDNGDFEIGIHIADVSYYVKENEAIDQEARERGTSIYLVDRVIPMLPEVLSNDLCSLKPNEDRLAFSAVFTMDKDARVKDVWFGQTIIHSDKRFSYEEAQAILEKGDGSLHGELTDMMTLARKLRNKRYQSGAIAFEQAEVKFELDEKGHPLRVFAKVRTETMLMIEDFMLLANQKVAEHIHNLTKSTGKNAAFVYRIHDTPDPEKIEELAIFINALGYEFNTHKGVVKATDINKLLKEVEGKPEENLIKTATIRSMAKAIYSTKNIGHFGLAFKFYTHFTSPIRRYPDLMVHRLLRRHLDGSTITGQELARYEKTSMQSSQREMEAVKAERDSIKYKQVEFLSDSVGKEFIGVITGVTDWGIYVEEKESKAEGMIRLASIIDDFYKHDANKYQVKGERTGKKYRLGDEVKVKLVKADLEERRLDFALV